MSALLGLTLITSGCYSPHVGVPVSARDERLADQARNLRLVDGQTTLADVSRHFGTPAYTTPDGLRAVYCWEIGQTSKSPFVLGWGMGAISPPDTHCIIRHFLVLHADSCGLIQWHGRALYDSSKDETPSLDAAAQLGPATRDPPERP